MRLTTASVALALVCAAVPLANLGWASEDAHHDAAPDAHGAGGAPHEGGGEGDGHGEAPPEPVKDKCYQAAEGEPSFLENIEAEAAAAKGAPHGDEHGGGDAHGGAAAPDAHGEVTHSTKSEHHAEGAVAEAAPSDAPQTMPAAEAGASHPAPPAEAAHQPQSAESPPAADAHAEPAAAAEHAPQEAAPGHGETPGGASHQPAEHGAAPAQDGHAETPPQDGQAEAAAPPRPQYEEPYKLIRTLEFVQDRITTGSREAHVYQRQLIAEIARKFGLVPDDAWKNPKNSDAAIIFALSGGSPKVLEKLLSLSPLPCVDDKLLKGLLAYSQGMSDAAKTWLTEIDPRSLMPRTAGHFSLAQAMLIAAENPKKAAQLLDLARILSPGTLVEEAALRREAVVAALIEDYPKFELLTSQYLRRFGKSVYAPEFVSRFAVAVASSKYATDTALFMNLAKVLDSLTPDQRQTAYLAITQAAIVRGKVDLTRSAAGVLAELAKSDPKLALQAKLYNAAAMLVTDKYQPAVAELASIDAARLPSRDRSLLQAALTLAGRLRAPPQISGPVSEPPQQPVSAEQATGVDLKKSPELIDKAKSLMGTAESLLNGDKR